MNTLVFASLNQGKVREVNELLNHYLKQPITLLSLEAVGITQQVDETGDSFKANATLKSRQIFNQLQQRYWVLSDDSGLVIPSLPDYVGVRSAEFLTEQGSLVQASQTLNQALFNKDRNAYFYTLLALSTTTDENCEYFEGTVQGTLTLEPRGAYGHGYDPIFQPLGYTKTFGEMTFEEKNLISHRQQAVMRLASYLNQRREELC